MADLGQHALILGFYGGSSPERTWPLWDGGDFPVEGRLATDDLVLRRAAAIRGDGIALLPHPMVMEAARGGQLERVLRDVVGFRGAAGIVYPERAFLQAKVRAFVDHLVAWAAAQPADACTEGR